MSTQNPTYVICTTDMLSAAASRILKDLEGKKRPSKVMVLNAIAAELAGQKHDWGFIKNAKSGVFLPETLRQNDLGAVLHAVSPSDEAQAADTTKADKLHSLVAPLHKQRTRKWDQSDDLLPMPDGVEKKISAIPISEGGARIILREMDRGWINCSLDLYPTQSEIADLYDMAQMPQLEREIRINDMVFWSKDGVISAHGVDSAYQDMCSNIPAQQIIDAIEPIWMLGVDPIDKSEVFAAVKNEVFEQVRAKSDIVGSEWILGARSNKVNSLIYHAAFMTTLRLAQEKTIDRLVEKLHDDPERLRFATQYAINGTSKDLYAVVDDILSHL